jgi:metallo-beta-lactamase family protein
MLNIKHHGAVTGVTGSCHELCLNSETSVLIDCGMFQGAESKHKEDFDKQIDFPLKHIKALFITHCHIDHVGRLPWLLAAGFKSKIYASRATAHLLPLVIEDALKIGVTKDKQLISKIIRYIKSNLIAVDYKQWITPIKTNSLQVRFQPAGHILGSAYIEFKYHNKITTFSGDLGAPYAPLLPAPKSPYRCDQLIIESTYGDKKHQARRERKNQLKKIITQALQNAGTVLIPAFSIGRTQELLYELESIIHSESNKRNTKKENHWNNIDIIVDSPLAAKFTEHYLALQELWDAEAQKRIKSGRHPLSFEQLTTINHHQQHLKLVNYLKHSGKPAIVIAASGMCAGGRISNYLKALLPDKRTDILFVGYQAQGTPGRAIQQYGPTGGYVYIDDEKIDIKAAIHTIGGYSAHADQNNLINFVKRMRHKPQQIRIVHGETQAKAALKEKFRGIVPNAEILIPME